MVKDAAFRAKQIVEQGQITVEKDRKLELTATERYESTPGSGLHGQGEAHIQAPVGIPLGNKDVSRLHVHIDQLEMAEKLVQGAGPYQFIQPAELLDVKTQQDLNFYEAVSRKNISGAVSICYPWLERLILRKATKRFGVSRVQLRQGI